MAKPLSQFPGGIAVLGTGTEVGKTVISALILARYGGELPVAYWKPVATGAEDERDLDTVGELCPGAHLLPETYLFQKPLSPHLAARLEGSSIEPQHLLSEFHRLKSSSAPRALIVEGAGGLLVPLRDEGPMLVDLFAQFGLPCVVVALSTLGTINHTLLTLEALRRRDVTIAGVVLNGPANPENRRAIRHLGEVEILGEVSTLRDLNATNLAQTATGFDTQVLLRPYLLHPDFTDAES